MLLEGLQWNFPGMCFVKEMRQLRLQSITTHDCHLHNESSSLLQWLFSNCCIGSWQNMSPLKDDKRERLLDVCLRKCEMFQLLIKKMSSFQLKKEHFILSKEKNFLLLVLKRLRHRQMLQLIIVWKVQIVASSCCFHLKEKDSMYHCFT